MRLILQHLDDIATNVANTYRLQAGVTRALASRHLFGGWGNPAVRINNCSALRKKRIAPLEGGTLPTPVEKLSHEDVECGEAR